MRTMTRASLAAALLLPAVFVLLPAQADDTRPGGGAAPAPAPKAEEPAPEKAKDFKLKDLDGKERTLAEFAGKWVVLEWTNYECPFVVKHYKPVPATTEGGQPTPAKMPQLQKQYTEKGVIWLSICSSAPGNQGHMEPAAWKDAVKQRMACPTAVLLDGDGTVGKEYGAKNTPSVWIVDPKGMIAYQGAVDDQPQARANPLEATSYIAQVLDAALAGQPLPLRSTKPYGCSVKYAK